MNDLRVANDYRSNGRSHLFYEGSLLSLCGRLIERFKVMPIGTHATCTDCSDALQAERREKAS
jgi:hypothetical protein